MGVALVDMKLTYPALFSLLGLTPHLAAEHFEAVVVDISEVETVLNPRGLRDRLGDRSWWKGIGSLFVEVEPHGEWLPCQRQAGDRWRTVTAQLDLSGGTIIVHAADLVRPGLAGQLPKMIKAYRVEPVANAEGLQPVRLPSGQEVDLVAGDFGRALVEERQLAEEIDDDALRARRVALAKSLAVSGAWGVFGRVDRLDHPRSVDVVTVGADGRERWTRRTPMKVEVVGFGPHGEEFRKTTTRPDQAGPLTLWHLAAADPAACRAIIAIAQHDAEIVGGSVAAVMTDSIAVPVSPEARHELLAILHRFDPLLHPDGGSAWTEEGGSLSAETVGLVVGVNKVLLGRREGDRFRLVRSSDSALGDHYVDPTGTGAHLDDGRTAWSFELEELLLGDAVVRGPRAPLRVPPHLPEWATDRPALRPLRASTLDDLRRLRSDLGDGTVGPFVRYVRAGGERGPVCLGTKRDPATWRSWPWRVHGRPCRVGILGDDGVLDLSEGDGPVHQVDTIRDVFRAWLRERDPTVDGPVRGLRHVLPVRSHPDLVEVVGRSGELAGEVAADDPVVYSDTGRRSLPAETSRFSGAEISRLSGLPARTAQRVVSGESVPSPKTVALATAAVVELSPRRCAAGAECRHAEDRLGALLGRRRRRWCSPACKEVARRRARGIPARSAASSHPGGPRKSRRRLPDARDVDPEAGWEAYPSCPSCRCVLLGRIPERCPDCGALLEALPV
jgi:hypothetical protein